MMRKQSFFMVVMIVCCEVLPTLAADEARQGSARAEGDAPKNVGTVSKDVFGLSKVWSFHVEMSAKEYDAMQPKGGMRGPGGRGGPGPFGAQPEPPAEKAAAPSAENPGEPSREVHKGNGFGVNYPIAKGDFTADGTSYKNVGVRYKGNATYMASSRSLKRSLKIELDQFDDDAPRFNGIKKINLTSGVMDPTKGHEALAYSVFRNAGVAAPRTAYAEVTLTVPGRYDREYLGLYTVVEQVDKTFLKTHFKSAKGLLLKPEGVRGVEYLGENWDSYSARYRPKDEPTVAQAKRLIDFAKLVNKAGDEQFRREIGSYLDVDQFLRFLAVNALVVNLDSFFGMGHNYYIYLNPESNKFVFIPWDLDLALAGFPMGGSSDQQLDLSLTHPHNGENRLIDRLLAMKEVNEKYQQVLKAVTAIAFTKERLLGDIETIEKAIQAPLAKEAKAVAARKESAGGGGFGPGGGMGGRAPTLRAFVEKRTASVTAQFAGTSKGYVPAGGFGPGGRPGGRGGPGGPGGFGFGNGLAKPLLTALDSDKDGKATKSELIAGVEAFFKENDKNNTGKLQEQAVADGLNRIIPPPEAGLGGPGEPGGGRRPVGPGGPGGPGGFGPGMFFAAVILQRADADKDSRLTRDELIAAAESMLKEADRNKDSNLDEEELTVGIAMLIPAPPGFGPGGGQPGGRLPNPSIDRPAKLDDSKTDK